MKSANTIIECVPNFCVGQNPFVIDQIARAITNVSGVTLQCIDTGYSANRTVYTFLGEIDAMFEAAYRSIRTAIEHIDMRTHQGTHPRFGAVDVFPFIPVRGITDEELVQKVHEFASQIAIEFQLPIYLYEKSQKLAYRKDLAKIRRGEYEGLASKIKDPKWIPDFYPHFNEKSGGMTMGVRNVLVAYNINLDTHDVEIAKKIAEEIRWSGKIVDGQRIHGRCAGVKAIGWYIRDFDTVQVSMNIVDVLKTPVHVAFEVCKELANQYGVSVTGCELIGCIPYKSIVDASLYYKKSMEETVEYMNFNDVKPFDLSIHVIDFEGIAAG